MVVDILEQIGSFGLVNVLICFFLIILAIVGGTTAIKKVLEAFGLVTIRTLKDREIEKRFAKLESKIEEVNDKIKATQDEFFGAQEKYHEESIQIRSRISQQQDDLRLTMGSLTDVLNAFIQRENAVTVASFRTQLWRLHRDFKAQGFVTPDGLKTFTEMARVYEDGGGNDILHDKLLPEVRALPIRYPDDVVYDN